MAWRGVSGEGSRTTGTLWFLPAPQDSGVSLDCSHTHDRLLKIGQFRVEEVPDGSIRADWLADHCPKQSCDSSGIEADSRYRCDRPSGGTRQRELKSDPALTSPTPSHRM